MNWLRKKIKNFIERQKKIDPEYVEIVNLFFDELLAPNKPTEKERQYAEDDGVNYEKYTQQDEI